MINQSIQARDAIFDQLRKVDTEFIQQCRKLERMEGDESFEESIQLLFEKYSAMVGLANQALVLYSDFEREALLAQIKSKNERNLPTRTLVEASERLNIQKNWIEGFLRGGKNLFRKTIEREIDRVKEYGNSNNTQTLPVDSPLRKGIIIKRTSF